MTDSLDERVTALERTLGRWRLATFAALALALAAVAAFAAERSVRDEVRARAFFLVNDTGDVTAKLVTNPRTGPVFLLSNTEIGAEVMLGSFGPDAGIGIIGGDGSSATLAIGKLAGPGLSLSEKNGKVIVGTGDGRWPTVWLKDADASLVATPSRLDFKDGNGRTRHAVVPSDTVQRPAP